MLLCHWFMHFHAIFTPSMLGRSKRPYTKMCSSPSPPTPTPQTTKPACLREKTYVEKDTELLRLGSTLGLSADHGHGAASLAQAEARGGGHTGSREGGRGAQKAHRGLEQQSRSHGHQHSSLEHCRDDSVVCVGGVGVG